MTDYVLIGGGKKYKLTYDAELPNSKTAISEALREYLTAHGGKTAYYTLKREGENSKKIFSGRIKVFEPDRN